jgi:hypothetical protein
MPASHAAPSNTPLTPEAMDAFWLPMTPNRAFKAKPRLFVAAEGMHYVEPDGRRILDGMAGSGASMPDMDRSASSRRSRPRQPSLTSSPRFR